MRNIGITSAASWKSLPLTCKTIGEPRYYRSPEEKGDFRLNSRRLNADWISDFSKKKLGKKLNRVVVVAMVVVLMVVVVVVVKRLGVGSSGTDVDDPISSSYREMAY